MYAAAIGGVLGLGVLVFKGVRGGGTAPAAADPNTPSTTAFLQSIGEQLLQLRGDESMAHADELTRDRTLLGTVGTGFNQQTHQNADILNNLNLQANVNMLNNTRLMELIDVTGLDEAARANQLGHLLGSTSPDLLGTNLQDTYQAVATNPDYIPSNANIIDPNDPTTNNGQGSEWFAQFSATPPSGVSAWV